MDESQQIPIWEVTVRYETKNVYYKNLAGADPRKIDQYTYTKTTPMSEVRRYCHKVTGKDIDEILKTIGPDRSITSISIQPRVAYFA